MPRPPSHKPFQSAALRSLPDAITRRHAPTLRPTQPKGPRSSRRWFLKGVTGCRNRFDCGLGTLRNGGEMTHLSPWSRMMLRVKMQTNAADAESRRPVWFAVFPDIAQQIRHGSRTNQIRRAQRQSANGAHMLLELARRASFDRPMPRIVRTRRELVHQQLAIALHEHLDREKTDKIELFRDGLSEISGGFFDCHGNAGGNNRDVENVIAMNIFADGKGLHRPIERTRDDRGDFLFKVDRAFEDQFVPWPLRPDLIRRCCLFQELLPFPVVTKRRA